MSQLCRVCGPRRLHADDLVMCPLHITELEPYEPEPAEPGAAGGEVAGGAAYGGAAAPQVAGGVAAGGAAGPEPGTGDARAVVWDRSRCWNCGRESPNEANTQCLNPECRRLLTPPALVIRFRFGQVDIEAGGQVELGRLGPQARLFGSYPNVSRRHAIVGVDGDGRPWIEPVPTPNGTFIDGHEIAASVRRPLRSNERVRFALHAEGTVTVYARQGYR
jgi:hypothetical protein